MIESNKNIKRIDSELLGEYILHRVGAMSHLKLQKLIYYVESFHLAYFDDSLIEDDFEAWVHGPVSRKIYNAVKDHSVLYDNVGYKQVDGEETPDVIIKKELTEDQLGIINDTIDEYSKFNGYQLENMTHSENPWLEARVGLGASDKCYKVISKDTMREYYKKMLYG